jgi:hypothetical protein
MPRILKTLLHALALLLCATPCLAGGYMSIRLGARATFTYVQEVDYFGNIILFPHDVTASMAYELKSTPTQKLLIIQ